MFNLLRKINHARLDRRTLKKLNERIKKLNEFGPNARAVYAQTNQGDFLVDPVDNHVAKKLLNDGEYGLKEIKLASQFLKKDSNCLVLGGHIGTLVIPLAKLCKKLIVFEANPKSFEFLNKNLRLNNISNVLAYNKAVNHDKNPIKFLISRDNSGGSKRLPVSSGRGYFYDNPDEIMMESVVLDDFMKAKSFDLIFVDIEGSEFFAFKGMQKIFKQSKVLITEFVPHHLKNVSSVSALDFWLTLSPHFNYMYVPKTHKLFKGSKKILEQLEFMFSTNENHDNLVFLKKIRLMFK
jgi:FkbM family methyltransferase